jgi:hypothetical protein
MNVNTVENPSNALSAVSQWSHVASSIIDQANTVAMPQHTHNASSLSASARMELLSLLIHHHVIQTVPIQQIPQQQRTVSCNLPVILVVVQGIRAYTAMLDYASQQGMKYVMDDQFLTFSLIATCNNCTSASSSPPAPTRILLGRACTMCTNRKRGGR